MHDRLVSIFIVTNVISLGNLHRDKNLINTQGNYRENTGNFIFKYICEPCIKIYTVLLLALLIIRKVMCYFAILCSLDLSCSICTVGQRRIEKFCEDVYVASVCW